MFQASRRADGSKPVVGSSRKSNSGLPMIPTPVEPPLLPPGAPTRTALRSSSPTSRRVSSTGRGLGKNFK